MMDAGIVTICDLIDTADPGDMAQYQLVPVSQAYFANRTMSYRRSYAARGANEQIDLLIRVWRDPEIRMGQYAVLSDSTDDGQYQITLIQHTVDADNLQISDLTLRRLDQLYEVATD